MKNSKTFFVIVAFATLSFQFLTFNSFSQPGSLDNTFGTNGKVTTPVGSSSDYGKAVAIQGDGKILVSGSSNNGGNNDDFALVRYNSDGTLDNAFGTGGKVTTAVGTGNNGDVGESVAIQSDGKIVVAGIADNGTSFDFALVRYNSNGSLDNTFGTNGIVTTAIGSGTDWGHSAAIQSDGKIVVAGISNNGVNNDFAIVRYNSNGSLDNTFGTGGKVTTAIGVAADEGYSVAIQSDGKIVVTGFSHNGTNNDFALVRYNTDGTLDNTFGAGGKAITDFGGTDEAYSVAIQSDGKIVGVGYSFTGGYNYFTIVRYTSNGGLDNTFGTGGKVTNLIGNASNGYSVAIQSDGKIVATGGSLSTFSSDFYLTRCNTNGSMDNTFGSSGIVSTDFTGTNDDGLSVTIQSDGKILVAGFSKVGFNFNFALARYIGIPTPPSNDDCSSAITLTQTVTCTPTNGTTVDAAQSIAAVTCGVNTSIVDDDVWYKFIATTAAPSIRVVSSSSFNAVVDLRSGACNGTNISCADATLNGGTETIYATGLTIGTIYYIRVYGFGSGTSAQGAFSICVFDGVTNDDCLGATTLTQTTTCNPANGTTIDATESIAAIICGSYTGSVADDDVWYKFVATTSSPTITVVGSSSFDAVVDLRSGACNGTNINCADATFGGGTEIINATGLTIGSTYYIRVYSYDSGSSHQGTFTVCVYSLASTGIEYANEAMTDFTMYPNPVKNNLTIETKNTHSKLHFEIINSVGTLVYSDVIDNKTTVGISSLSNGIYIVKLFAGESTIIKKFTKQ